MDKKMRMLIGIGVAILCVALLLWFMYFRYFFLPELPESLEGGYEDDQIKITADAEKNESNKYEIRASVTNPADDTNVTLPYVPDTCELTLYFSGRTPANDNSQGCPAVSGYSMNEGETTTIESSWGSRSFHRMNYTFQVKYETNGSRKTVNVQLE
ncbi:hypothetical protein [Salibacterium sp. K-3]